MGILNVTPDSFYDRGKYAEPDAALKRAETLIKEGADIIDIGGESTRPGSLPVPLESEIGRVIPVVKHLQKYFKSIPVSVDTQKAEVARLALSEGAKIINDVSAFRTDQKKMEKVLNEFKPTIILMHMQGTPQTMQLNPRYRDVVGEVKQFLAERVQWAREAGVPKSRIWIDPGIGFGKQLKHNLQLLQNLGKLKSIGSGLVVGCSRKSFIGMILKSEEGLLPAEDRLEGSLAAACWAALQGASVLRVHDVGPTKKAIQTVEAIRSAA